MAAPGKILLMKVGHHAILYLAFSFLPCGFGATNLYWCRRPSQQRTSISHVSRRSRSLLSLAYKLDPCPWIGLWILLPDPIFPDFRFLLRFPAANNTKVLFQLPHVPVGDRMLFKHNRKYYSVLQGGMGVELALLEVCGVLLGTPEVSLDLFFPNRRTESSNSNISRISLTPTTSYVSRRCMVRTSISRLFRCWLRDLGFLVLFSS